MLTWKLLLVLLIDCQQPERRTDGQNKKVRLCGMRYLVGVGIRIKLSDRGQGSNLWWSGPGADSLTDCATTSLNNASSNKNIFQRPAEKLLYYSDPTVREQLFHGELSVAQLTKYDQPLYRRCTVIIEPINSTLWDRRNRLYCRDHVLTVNADYYQSIYPV